MAIFLKDNEVISLPRGAAFTSQYNYFLALPDTRNVPTYSEEIVLKSES